MRTPQSARIDNEPTKFVEINKEQSLTLHRDLQWVLRLAKPTDLDQMLTLTPLVAGMVNDRLPDFASAFRGLAGPMAPPALVVTGLPVDESPEETPIGDLLSLTFARMLGEPFQYAQQNGGRLVARLAVKPGLEKKANTGEGNGEFRAHTDDRIWAPDYSTDWIQLYGVRNDAGASTSFMPVDPPVAQLSERSRQILAEHRFVFQAPASFGFRYTLQSQPLPVLWKNATDQWQVGLPTYNCRPASEGDTEAADALAEFIALVNEEQFTERLVIQPGTVLIFDNNRGLHARSAFEGYRLVLRTYIRRNLTAMREKSGTNGNIFDAWQLLG